MYVTFSVTSIKSLNPSSMKPRRVKKVVSDSPGLVDFAIGLVNSVLNLSEGQANIFGVLKLQKYCKTNIFNS